MKTITSLIVLILLGACTPQEKATLTDEELRQKADELAHKFIITDGHVDLPYRMHAKGFMSRNAVEDISVETNGDFDIPKAKKGGLDAPFMSIYIPARYQGSGGAKAFADSLIDMVGRLPESFPDHFAMASTPSEVESNFENGLISLPMGMENGAAIEDDITNVKYFADRGIRYITLTHGKDNQICDSSYDTAYTWNGLSPFGEQVVSEMNKWGIMIDISHITDSAAYDVLRLTNAPVIASHSSCRKFTPGFHRNMPDELIKMLAENGGVIHINFGSTFLSKESQDKFDQVEVQVEKYAEENNLGRRDSAYRAYSSQYATEIGAYVDLSVVADHIDYVVQLAGIDNVGLGSDFDGVGDSLPIGLKDASMYPNLIYELLKRGYSDDDIAKICYQNTFRVWNEVSRIVSELQGS